MTQERTKGRGFPPKEFQFKPGQTGNPKGRPKGSMNFHKILNLILKENAKIVIGDRTIKMPKKQILALKAVNSAMQGDLKSLQLLLPHILMAEKQQAEQEAKKEALSKDDAAILAAYINQNKE
jgi:hypothetical protein